LIPVLLIELIDREDVYLSRNCVQYASNVLRYSTAQVNGIKGALAGLSRLMNSTDHDILLYLVYGIDLLLKSPVFNSRLFEEFPILESLSHFLQSGFPDVAARTCLIIGNLFKRRLALNLKFAFEDILPLLSDDNSNVQISAFWCVCCGIIEDRFELALLCEHFTELYQNKFFSRSYDVACEAGFALTAIIRRVDQNDLQIFLQNGILTVLARYLEFENPLIQQDTCESLTRVLDAALARGDAQGFVSEFSDLHGMEILEGLQSCETNSIAKCARHLVRQIEAVISSTGDTFTIL
jgi:hypothetical protein